MTKITLGLLIIATCTALLNAGAEAGAEVADTAAELTSGLDLGSTR